MKKLSLALAVSLSLVLLLIGNVFAGVTVIDYDDTSSNFTPPEGGPDSNSLIRNGDFSAWTAGMPDNWTVWGDTKAGWEDVHLATVDLSDPANRPVGVNDALGFFARNVGGSGSYYAGAYQHLDLIPAAGLYFVNVSVTAWYDNPSGPYNSVAWYGIGSSSEPSSVSEWRELYPDQFVCHNSAQSCWYGGRDEVISISPGEYFHLQVSHKFPFFNSWTTWVIDDISIVAADGSQPETIGYYTWVDEDGDPAVVRWDREATR